MRSASTWRRGPSVGRTLAWTAVAALGGAAAVIATLWALGVELPFLGSKAVAKTRRAGIPVPLTSVAIPAYTRIIPREHLVDLKTGEPTVEYFSAEDIRRNGFITDPNLIRGRVLKRDKLARTAFTEDDFFPEGTRPGVVAGVPPSKRSFVLQADRVSGIHALKAGDHFDLIGTMPVDFDKALGKYRAPGLPEAVLPSTSHLPKRASVKVLVHDGVIVLPVTSREVPVGTPTRPGMPQPTRTIQEVTIAIAPEEVAPLADALTSHAEIICIARSGHPDDPGPSSVTPSSIATPNVTAMETIVGSKRTVLVFPTPGAGPVEPSSPAATAEATTRNRP
ncbi:MAG: hypothetical protein NZ700_04795 [Gemmataceae bacterium]|nr:hypothetical protein [Gemmataceae bacterium]MDW8264061.1 hypothetical protein [Gemmataceae bacterium]